MSVSKGTPIGLKQCAETTPQPLPKPFAITNLVGVDHVSLGSDFDGAVQVPFDVTGLPLLTAALQEEGFTTEEISKIMGLNTLRVLNTVLPG